MIIKSKNQSKAAIIIAALSIGFLFQCAKDKVPVNSPNELTKWEKISGDYKVYDTNGIFLYDMSISHIRNNQNNTDSLHFVNYGNLFTMTCYQSPWSGIPEGYIEIGSHNPLKDKFGNKWDLSQATNFNFNFLENDTIKLRYRRVNILYYLSELVPYCDTTIIEIAVKQN